MTNNRYIHRFVTVCLAAILIALTQGCAGTLQPSISNNAYERQHARQTAQVQMGTVEFVRTVSIEGSRSVISPAVGAVVAGVAANTVSRGKWRSLATTVGAATGAYGGRAIEQAILREDGLELQVRLDGGRSIVVTQAADVQFVPGDRVRVISGGGGVRITH